MMSIAVSFAAPRPRSVVSRRSVALSSATFLAMPKSMSLGSAPPSGRRARKTLLGFTSRCKNPLSCTAWSAWHRPDATPIASPGASGPLRASRSASVSPWSSSITQYGAPSGLDARVVYLDDAGVADARGDPRLADEPGALVGVPATVCQQLDGDLPGEVDLMRGVHLAAPALSEQLAEAVLARDSRLRSGALGAAPRRAWRTGAGIDWRMTRPRARRERRLPTGVSGSEKLRPLARGRRRPIGAPPGTPLISGGSAGGGGGAGAEAIAVAGAAGGCGAGWTGGYGGSPPTVAGARGSGARREAGRGDGGDGSGTEAGAVEGAGSAADEDEGGGSGPGLRLGAAAAGSGAGPEVAGGRSGGTNLTD